MEEYRDFASEDFMQDGHFRKWVMSNDAETDRFWQQFLNLYPEKRGVIRSARAMLRAMSILQATPDEHQEIRMWENISARTGDVVAEPEKVPELNVSRRYIWQWAAAASVVLALCFLGWYLNGFSTERASHTYAAQVEKLHNELVEHVNATGKLEKIVLPDGSKIELYPQSRVSYAPNFLVEKREVYLTGKAFFEVIKNDKKPFIVYANRLVTQVVGTSFMVTSTSEHEPARVAVKTGKVKVFTISAYHKAGNAVPEETVLLSPNQQVYYDPQRDVLSKTFVPEPAVLKVPEKYPEFLFENISVAQVFETLAESYGVSISYDAATVAGCNLTAPLGNEPLFRKLDIICQTIGATYQVWGTEIVITGKGCNLH
ncbi:FecR family protein [Dyadobacter sp. CY323]|uniref:FecR family protein n=1 Tax=Dyadobacter sp. CY323 TaxID=2907302 RepID=UPI001F23C37D|nr:FecR family protein [Dyadobacter sp. CY323]MCE6992631.1 FecR family protein [Dyadobacter sp. CY323]